MHRRLRLRHRADFKALRRDGRRLSHSLAILIVNPNGRETSRFGFSASRRVGKAHQRNRAKRLLREAVRLHQDKVRPGWDCLFLARKKTSGAHFVDVEKAVSLLLQALNGLAEVPGRAPK
jgi:ribonuclease P protein component